MSENASADDGLCTTPDPNPKIADAPRVPHLIFAYLLIVLFLVLTPTLSVLFLKRRQEYAILRTRNVFLVFTTVLGCLFQVFYAFDSVFGLKCFPCALLENLVIISFSFIWLPQCFSALRYYFKSRLTKTLSAFNISTALKNPIDKRLTGIPNETGLKVFQTLLIKKSDSCCDSFWDINCCSSGSNEPNVFPKKMLIFASTKLFGTILMTIVYLITLPILIVRAIDVVGAYSPCRRGEDTAFFELLILFGLCLPGMIYLLYSIRNEPDPFKLKFEIYSVISLGAFGSFVSAVWLIADDNSDNPTNFNASLIFSATALIVEVIVLGYPLYLSYKEEKLKAITSPYMLQDLLDTQTGRNLFKVFLMKEFSVENYLFWSDSKNYKEKFEERNVIDNMSMRKLIFESYVVNSSKLQINISYTSVQLISERCKHNQPSPSDFDEALDEVYQNMEHDSFPRFRATDQYKDLTWETDR